MAFDSTQTTLIARETEEKIDKIKNHLIEKWRNAETVSKEEIKEDIRQRFKEGGIDDEKLRYIGLAFSFSEGSSYLESGLDAYCSHLSDGILKKLEKKEDPTKKVYFVKFDEGKLNTLDDNQSEEYILSCLSSAGIPEAALDKPISNFEHLNTEFKTHLPSDGTLRDAFVTLLSKRKEEIKSQTDERLSAYNEYPSNESQQSLSELNQKDLTKALIGHPELIGFLNDFNKNYVDVLQSLTSYNTDNNSLSIVCSKLERSYESLQNACKSCDSDGDYVTKFCDDMMEKLDSVAQAKFQDPNTSIKKLSETERDNNKDQQSAKSNNNNEIVKTLTNALVGKPDLIDNFASFTANCIELLDNLMSEPLDMNKIGKSCNDIMNNFDKLLKTCKNYGKDGSTILNYSDYMIETHDAVLKEKLKDPRVSIKMLSEAYKNSQAKSQKKENKKPIIDAGNRALLENEPEPNEPTTKNSLDNLGEGTGNINYFVGYDKKGVARLFENKSDLLKIFEEFVQKYNYLMNLYVDHKLDEIQADVFHKEIIPYLNVLSSACSSAGADGVQIKNLADGMMGILEEAYTAEINGVDLNSHTTRLNIEKMKLTYYDDDGKTNDYIQLCEKSKDLPDGQMFDGAINELVGSKHLDSSNESQFTDDELEFVSYMGLGDVSPKELRDYLGTPVGQKDLAFYEQMRGEKVLGKN